MLFQCDRNKFRSIFTVWLCKIVLIFQRFLAVGKFSDDLCNKRLLFFLLLFQNALALETFFTPSLVAIYLPDDGDKDKSRSHIQGGLFPQSFALIYEDTPPVAVMPIEISKEGIYNEHIPEEISKFI